MHPSLARSLGNPITVPKDSEALAVVGGVGLLMGTALASYAVSSPLAPRPGLAAVVQTGIGIAAGIGAFRMNQSHPRFATALGITSVLAAFGAISNLVIAMRLGATPQVAPAPAPTPAPTQGA